MTFFNPLSNISPFFVVNSFVFREPETSLGEKTFKLYSGLSSRTVVFKYKPVINQLQELYDVKCYTFHISV